MERLLVCGVFSRNVTCYDVDSCAIFLLRERDAGQFVDVTPKKAAFVIFIMEQGAERADWLAVEINLEERIIILCVNVEAAIVNGELRFGCLVEIEDGLFQIVRTF